MAVEGAPKFLYSVPAKKLHKRYKTKYQKRRLEFHSDRVEYFKVDSSIKCGTIPLQGARIDLVPETPNHFQFIYDDIKDRGYVFMSNVETNLAHILWVSNGEQYNTYEATQRKLRYATITYMLNSKSQNIIRELVNKRYKQASIYFTSLLAVPNFSPMTRDYEDVNTCGLDREAIPTDSSSSDDESGSSYTKSVKNFALSRTRAVTSFDKSDDTESEYISLPIRNIDADCSIIDRVGILNKMKGVGSFDNSDYLSAPSNLLDGLQNDIDHSMRRSKRGGKNTGKKDVFEGSSSGNNTTYFILNNTHDLSIDLMAKEVNAIKIRIRGQEDFIEVDYAEVGTTFEAFKSMISIELDLHMSDVACIRKLPNVRMRNDEDILRLRPGNKIEIELN